MPLYAYHCTDCGADFDALHKADALLVRCGLNCQRRDAGAFGHGAVERVLSAPAVRIDGGATAPSSRSGKDALERMGGPLSEAELDRARDGGLTVYRRDGALWSKDGGDAAMPTQLRAPPGRGR